MGRPPLRFAVQATNASDGRQWRDIARKAQDLGYSTLFLSDHYLGPGPAARAARTPRQDLAPIAAMATAAAVTDTLRIGCRVFCIDYHVPAVLAKEAATLDLLSDGRLELGIGAGWSADEYSAMGLTFDAPGRRIAKLAEVVALLRPRTSPRSPTTPRARWRKWRTRPGSRSWRPSHPLWPGSAACSLLIERSPKHCPVPEGEFMTKPDKVGSRDSAARDRMLDATIQIMLEEGYAAATSRRVAALAGVKPALVHYYFPTMDDLYLAVFRRGAEANLDRQQAALASDRPLHALWETVSEPRGTRILLEFMGLANHRKKIRAEIAAWSERWREMQITALNFIVRQSGMDADELPPAALAVVVASIGRTLVLEQALGTTGGHDEAIALVNRFINRYEMPQPKRFANRGSGHSLQDSEGGAGMPNPSIKNEKLYEDLRKEGNSKQKSARIANAAAARGKSAVGRKGGKSGSYDDWTVADLKKRAKEIGLSGYSNLSKDKLISKIRNS